jgi:AcrR family transcriptional regulator
MPVYINLRAVYGVDKRRDAMSSGTPVIADQHNPSAQGGVRSRDAASTRQSLLHAARIRFARDGFAATTVREIATDAGVNVALINRYFVSKEGLFEACIARVAEELGRPDDVPATVSQIVQRILAQLPEVGTGEYPLELLLLLRTSGDAGADLIRRNIMQSFAERMAVAAGWHAGRADGDALLLRAQLALSTALGIALLRSSTGIEPLTSATAAELEKPLEDVLSALLSPADALQARMTD